MSQIHLDITIPVAQEATCHQEVFEGLIRGLSSGSVQCLQTYGLNFSGCLKHIEELRAALPLWAGSVHPIRCQRDIISRINRIDCSSPDAVETIITLVCRYIESIREMNLALDKSCAALANATTTLVQIMDAERESSPKREAIHAHLSIVHVTINTCTQQDQVIKQNIESLKILWGLESPQT